jgi:hypothetical protein
MDPSLCSNPCWNQFVQEFTSLFNSKCLNDDPAPLNTMCFADSLCTIQEAITCVEDWVTLRCPRNNDEILSRCAAFSVCAYLAAMEGKCDVIPIVESPAFSANATIWTPKTCYHLRNCSNHGVCNEGKCMCNRG